MRVSRNSREFANHARIPLITDYEYPRSILVKMRKWLAAIVTFVPFRGMRKMLRTLFRDELISRAWLMYFNGDDRRALARFCQGNDATAWKQDCLYDFWLIWASALYELGDKAGAVRVIKRYAERYGIFDIFRYVLAAKCALESGITSTEIEQAVYVWEHFQKSRKEKLIEKMINGKRIAIVGNGPQALGKGKGKEIDAADIVIRFNGYKTKGYEKDYGARTDIWVWGAGEGEVEEAMIPDSKVMVWAPGYEHFKIINDYLGVLYRNMKGNKTAFDYLPVKNWIQLIKETKTTMGGKTPTTGTQFLHYISKYTNPSWIDFYGFSFMDDAPVEFYDHYYMDKEKYLENSGKTHNIRKENEYLRNLFPERKKK